MQGIANRRKVIAKRAGDLLAGSQARGADESAPPSGNSGRVIFAVCLAESPQNQLSEKKAAP
jgi:hypothetical protein